MPTNRPIERIEEHYRAALDNHVERGEEEGHLGVHAGYHEREDASPAEAARAMRERLRAAADVEAGDRVLDAGCGFGDAAVWLADEVGASVVGIDVVEEQLAVARETAERRGVSDRVRFVREDFHEMGAIEDNSVDVVWACEALCHARSDREVLEQAARVLDRGGRVVVADTFLTERDLSDEEREAFEELCEGYVANFEHVEELLDSLDACGFEVLEREDATEAVLPSLRRRRRRGVLLDVYADRERQLGFGDETDAAFATALRHHHDLMDEGVLGYAVVSGRLA